MSELLAFVNNAVTFVGHIFALLGGGFAAIGTASAATGVRWSINIAQMPLSLRVVLMVVLAASLGWLFGAIVSWLSADLNDGRKVLSLIIAGIFGGLVVFSADWLAVRTHTDSLPEVQVFSAIGVAVALWVGTFQCRLHADGAGKGVLLTRATAFLTFGLASLGLIALTLAGGA